MQSRTRIKVCGITRLQDALQASDCGADSIGLVFHPPSPRFIDPEAALEISRALPPFVTVTALFLDEKEDWVAEVVQRLQPDCLQFHGNEPPEFCEIWGRPYIKSIPMGSIVDPCAYAQLHENAQGFLFDSNVAGRQGGSGDTFDWLKIPPAFEHRLILAGGINPSNVADAIIQVKPWAVDVSSGVEASRGVKNSDLIEQFFHGVKCGDARKSEQDSVVPR
ncbi:MAG: phosphoribosylanthranilate isomerase [Gammaproteobacteria bacterium]|jgi:phosphoribosylanthranilate isomerase|nr:phosphoribosylanthranilate isomerase [Gammaproteobacteria bacterium]